jgi:AcrR family transcriptional regulator
MPSSARASGRPGNGRPPSRAAAGGSRSTAARGSSLEDRPLAQMQRARLLAAATELASERGIASVSVGAIVTRCGMSRRTFYELFENVEDCLLAAFDQAAERVASAVLPAFEAQRRWQDALRAGLEALLRALDADPHGARFLLIESPAAGRLTIERRGRLLAALAKAIDRGRGERAKGVPAPPLTAEGLAGAVCFLLQTRLLEPDRRPLVALANPLMSMLVLPYLGPAAASAELRRPAPRAPARPPAAEPAPGTLLKDLPMRVTYRTVRVLLAVDELGARGINPSNREVSRLAGVGDQGQMSKLLRRLERLRLIVNEGAEGERGAPNAWRLTERGDEVLRLAR